MSKDEPQGEALACRWCGYQPVTSKVPKQSEISTVMCSNRACPVRSAGWLSMKTWNGTRATPLPAAVEHITINGEDRIVIPCPDNKPGCEVLHTAPAASPGGIGAAVKQSTETWADPDCPTLEEAETFLRAQGINPADLPNQFIEYLGKRHAELARLARALCEKLRSVHADSAYQDVWMSAQLHQGPYSGPTYTDELEALESYFAPQGEVFNINDEATVTLTPSGEAAWRAYWTRYGGDYVPDLVNSKLSTELWTLIVAFGPHMSMAGPQMFVENRIEIRRRT